MKHLATMTRMLFFIFVLTLALFLGCGDDDSSDDDSQESDDDDDSADEQQLYFRILKGNLQSGFVGDKLEDFLVVSVTYADDAPATGEQVRFEVLSGIGEGKGTAIIGEEPATVNKCGLATREVTLGDTPGIVRIRAVAVNGNARPVTFTLSAFPKPSGNKKPISFVSINDFHTRLKPWGHPDDLQGGIARIVYLMKKIRRHNDAVGISTLILNGGDDTENTMYNDVPGLLEWLVAKWDEAGVDVWQVGNHDFHFGIPYLTDFLKTAQQNFTSGDKGHPMTVIFGNADPSTFKEDYTSYAADFETGFNDPADELLYQQTAILDVNGIKIGILGAVTDAAVYTQVPGDPFFLKIIGAPNPYSQGLTFIDPDPRKSDFIAKGIDDLAQRGADVVVVVSHSGLGFGDRVNIPPGKDEFIAMYGVGEFSGRAVDLLVSAHSHVQLNHPIYVENPAGTTTPIVQAREGGLFAYRVDAIVDTEAGGMEIVDARLIQINSDLLADSDTYDEMEYWQEQAKLTYGDWFDWELIEIDSWLSHRAQTVSGLGKLINRSFEWACEKAGAAVDGSIAVPSLYRADLWPGTITGDRAYDVLPLHKMSDDGHAADSIAVMTFRPGLMDASMLLLPGSWHLDTTALEFAIEVVHSIGELLDLVPFMGEQLKIDVAQMSGVEYEVDLTAPIFHHVVPGSVTVDGQSVDPNKSYRVAMVHSMATTLVYALNTLVIATAEGEGLVKILVDDPNTGEPMEDTLIPIWQALQEYLAALPYDVLPEEEISVTGQKLLTVQPDLMVNPSDIFVDVDDDREAKISVRVRNNGTQQADAVVRTYVDVTPWDVTDQDDYRSDLEGMPANYLGSLHEVGNKKITIGAHPAVKDLEFTWTPEEDQPPGLYTVHVRIDDIEGNEIDPNTSEPYTDWLPDNNLGEQVMNYFTLY